MSGSGSELQAACLAHVASVMAQAGEPVGGQLEATLITGGRSNLTYVLTDGVRRWVLRTPPRMGRTPSAHDVVREARITAALHGTELPVARSVVVSEGDIVPGLPFVVSEYVDGTTIQTAADLDRLPPESVERIVDALLASLAALHRVKPETVGLGGLARPDGYAARQLKRWSSQWDLVGTTDLGPLAAEVFAFLRARVPDQPRSAIVHGDYRIDNTLLDLPRCAVLAVVDWELATLGDPVGDVAMMCAYRDPAFDLIVGEASAWTSSLLPSPEALAAGYEAAARVRLQNWEFHAALASAKIAVIAAGIDHRRHAGGSSGPGFDTAAAAVQPFLEGALSALRRGA